MGKGARPKSHQRKGGITGKKHKDGDDDYKSLKLQLEACGLGLKKIPGDGNCLFRAFSDQLYGSSDRHRDIRLEVVDYMRFNREFFEPFIDEHSFDEHLKLLSEDGTYGGNDAIAAFSSCYNVTVVIHQPNNPVWRAEPFRPDGSSPQRGRSPPREIHISYHNGDHYNSVRRLGRENEPGPANVKIGHSPSRPKKSYPKPTEYSDDVDAVMKQSGCNDHLLAEEALQNSANCVEAAVDYLKELCEEEGSSEESDAKQSSLWREGGTGNRIFGAEAARKARNKHSLSEEKRARIKERLTSSKISNKRKRQLKKAEKRLANNERRQNEREGKDPVDEVIPNMDSLAI